MDVYSVSAIREILKARSLRPTKARGQNFLFDKNIVHKIANTLPKNVTRGMRGFEIGGGLGALTEALLECYNGNLRVVEFDSGLHAYLRETHPALDLVHEDVLNVRLFDYKEPADVYGNIPYNISSHIIEWLLIDNAGKWNFAAFMVQSDFAKRLTASPGEKEYSALTLLANFAADVSCAFKVPKTAFYPAPEVESHVITLTPSNRYPIDDFPMFRLIARAAFHNRRKTIRNNLITAPFLSLTAEATDTALARADIPPSVRGETLSVDRMYALAKRVESISPQ